MSHWTTNSTHWGKLQAPLRPNTDVVACVRKLTGDPTGPVLLLGVTPELADAFAVVQAIDKNPGMIANVWPGDGPNKRAEQGDWLDLDRSERRFSAAVGDGSLNCTCSLRELRSLLAVARDVLAPGGRFACRLFERPANSFTAADLADTASGRAKLNFHAFKWQIAMHLAGQVGAAIPVALILQRFNELHPDRDELAKRTGWPREAIDTIDIYLGSPVVFVFPDRAEFTAALPDGIGDVRFSDCGSYDLANCCPILSFRKA